MTLCERCDRWACVKYLTMWFCLSCWNQHRRWLNQLNGVPQ